MTPQIAAARLGWSLLLGALVGVTGDFLKPLGRRTDPLLMLVFGWAWLYLNFAVCRGDIRMGCMLALLAGWGLWELGPGRLVQPVFDRFWKTLAAIFRFFLAPLKKISDFAKILFASGQKWVTIKCTFL